MPDVSRNINRCKCRSSALAGGEIGTGEICSNGMGRRCTKRELQSLIGTLQYASRVVRPGRSFLCRMIDLAKIPKRPHHFVQLNMEFRADLRWWHVFADHWNGVAVIPAMAAPEIEVTSDASGHWGCGAWSQANWFHY